VTPIGVGVIGAGVAALTGHLPALACDNRFALLALLDTSAEQLDRAAERFPGAFMTTDQERFFAVPGLDAVVCATPPQTHFDLAAAALERGKHVLLEKPLARTRRECVELIKLAGKHGVFLAVGHEKRFHPTFERVRALLADGAIGLPFYCGVHWASNAKLDPEHLVPEGFRHGYEWRWGDPEVGGGLLQDHLPHYVDLLRYWLGWSEGTSLWDDFALVVVRFSGELLLRFETAVVGRSLSPIWSLGSGVGEWTEYGYVLGTDGQLVFDMLPWDSSENGRVALWELARAVAAGLGWTSVEQPEPPRRVGSPAGASGVMFAAQAAEWAKGIADEPSRIATGEDGAICLAVVDAAYRSAEVRRECPVEFDLGVAA
jgi:predicted dehydrogenase